MSILRSACNYLLTVVLLAQSSMFGVTITLNQISSGNLIGNTGTTATVAPSNAVGAGALAAIVAAAAHQWELTFLDSLSLTINYGWGAIASAGSLAFHSLEAESGSPNRETLGSIVFDSDLSSVFFLDSTPLDNSEYTTFTSSTADLGGGTMNVGRVYTGGSGNAAQIDLFSVALHEIGHALGLSSGNSSFIAENVDLDVDLTAPRNYPGAAIPTISGAHLNLANALMFPTIGGGLRRIASEADILADAQISQFTNFQTNPTGVPEPATWLLLSSGLALLITVRRRSAVTWNRS